MPIRGCSTGSRRQSRGHRRPDRRHRQLRRRARGVWRSGGGHRQNGVQLALRPGDDWVLARKGGGACSGPANRRAISEPGAAAARGGAGLCAAAYEGARRQAWRPPCPRGQVNPLRCSCHEYAAGPRRWISWSRERNHGTTRRAVSWSANGRQGAVRQQARRPGTSAGGGPCPYGQCGRAASGRPADALKAAIRR